MYTQNNQMPQYLADFIVQQANVGPVQNYIWQMASQNNYNNEFFQQRLDTLQQVVQYWGSNGGQVDINQAISTVYYCTCGMTAARYPQMAQQMSQQDYNAWMQWAQQAQALSAELSQFMSQFRQPQYGTAPQYGNVPQPGVRGGPPQQHQNPWDAAQAQQQSGWGAAPQQPQYGRPSPNPNSAFAVQNQPSPRQAAPQQPVQYTPRSGGDGGMRGRYGRNRSQTEQQQPQQRPVTQVQPSTNQPPNFMSPRKGTWRSRNNNSGQERFNPDNPQHAPVGREVAEAHENAANARASWEVSDHEWDNENVIGFDEGMEAPPKATVSHVNQNHSGTPQFMERLSSNPDVQNYLYGKDTDQGYFEFTIEDWRTKPDPDFPWEIGYTPATRTRRIAFDVKRQCFVQIIEENDVKFDDHVIIEQSAAVRNTAATRSRPAREVVNIDDAKVVTLGDLSTGRQKVLDSRLAVAQESWEHQETDAQTKAKESGNYVAPELTPTREEALDTPTDDETDDDAMLAIGRLQADQIVTVDMGQESISTEQHALYTAQSKLALDNFDSTDIPLLLTRYIETTPFLLNVDEAEHALEKLQNLTANSSIKNMVDMSKHLKNIVDDIPTYLWNAIDAQLTDYVNGVLQTELGLVGMEITSFAEDGADLPAYLGEKKGKKFLEALSRHIAEFMTPLRCISIPEADEELAERTVLLRRETTLAKLDFTSQELGIYADKAEFVITASSAPNIHKLIKLILEKTSREDGKAGFHKRVLLLEDGSRFTLHNGWMGDDTVYILKR